MLQLFTSPYFKRHWFSAWRFPRVLFYTWFPGYEGRIKNRYYNTITCHRFTERLPVSFFFFLVKFATIYRWFPVYKPNWIIYFKNYTKRRQKKKKIKIWAVYNAGSLFSSALKRELSCVQYHPDFSRTPLAYPRPVPGMSGFFFVFFFCFVKRKTFEVDFIKD